MATHRVTPALGTPRERKLITHFKKTNPAGAAPSEARELRRAGGEIWRRNATAEYKRGPARTLIQWGSLC